MCVELSAFTKKLIERIQIYLHVICDMATQNILAMSVSIQCLILLVEPWEPLLTVGNVQSSIQSSLFWKKKCLEAHMIYAPNGTQLVIKFRCSIV